METVYLPEGVEPTDRNDSILTHLVSLFDLLLAEMKVTDEDTVIIVVWTTVINWSIGTESFWGESAHSY